MPLTVDFVTCSSTSMPYDVLERRPLSVRGPVLVDEVILLTGLQIGDRCPLPLRRVIIWDERWQRRPTFLTNFMHLMASTTSFDRLLVDNFKV